MSAKSPTRRYDSFFRAAVWLVLLAAAHGAEDGKPTFIIAGDIRDGEIHTTIEYLDLRKELAKYRMPEDRPGQQSARVCLKVSCGREVDWASLVLERMERDGGRTSWAVASGRLPIKMAMEGENALRTYEPVYFDAGVVYRLAIRERGTGDRLVGTGEAIFVESQARPATICTRILGIFRLLRRSRAYEV